MENRRWKVKNDSERAVSGANERESEGDKLGEVALFSLY